VNAKVNAGSEMQPPVSTRSAPAKKTVRPSKVKAAVVTEVVSEKKTAASRKSNPSRGTLTDKSVPAPSDVAKKVETNTAETIVAPAADLEREPAMNRSSMPVKLAKRPKQVRDSFTFPVDEYSLIGVLKRKAIANQRETKKSEIVRAGLAVLAPLSDEALKDVLDQLQPVKAGRPRK
jgi:hypothetical protein